MQADHKGNSTKEHSNSYLLCQPDTHTHSGVGYAPMTTGAGAKSSNGDASTVLSSPIGLLEGMLGYYKDLIIVECLIKGMMWH